jgi:hypothetical protein
MLGFEFEGLNPEHGKINAKVGNAKACGFQSKTSESINKCFHYVLLGIPRGLFIGKLGDWFTISKQP